MSKTQGCLLLSSKKIIPNSNNLITHYLKVEKINNDIITPQL